MVKYTIRRLVQAIPILFGITILSYLLMAGSPGGPAATLTFSPKITPQQRQKLAEQIGVNDPLWLQYLRWLLGDDWMRWDANNDGVADHTIFLPLNSRVTTTPQLPDVRRLLDNTFLQPFDFSLTGNALPVGKGKGILRGDFGRSLYAPRAAIDIITERIPATLELGISALFFSLLLGVPIGILAAVRRGGWFDNLTRVMAVVFNAVPVFWLGLVLILLVGFVLPDLFFKWGWVTSTQPVLPMGGRCPAVLTTGCPPIQNRLNYLLLPTFVLASGGIAVYSRYMRASMLEIINQDYIRTARAKGLPMRQVWFKHGARNALIPLATFLGPTITGLLGGAAITETVFSWPGLGRLGVTSVFQKDFPVVMAFVIIGAFATVLGYLFSDILYAIIDPRIRFS